VRRISDGDPWADSQHRPGLHPCLGIVGVGSDTGTPSPANPGPGRREPTKRVCAPGRRPSGCLHTAGPIVSCWPGTTARALKAYRATSLVYGCPAIWELTELLEDGTARLFSAGRDQVQLAWMPKAREQTQDRARSIDSRTMSRSGRNIGRKVEVAHEIKKTSWQTPLYSPPFMTSILLAGREEKPSFQAQWGRSSIFGVPGR